MKRLGNPAYRRLGMQGLPWGFGPAVPRNYFRKVLTPNPDVGYDPASMIGFWPQNELEGAVSYDHSGEGNNGAYQNATIGQPGVPGMGMTSVFFDGTGDVNDLTSAGLNADFDGEEGSFLLWAQPFNAGVWTDTALRRLFYFFDDGDNRVYAQSDGAGTMNLVYEANNVVEVHGPATWTNFRPIGLTWSLIADEVRFFSAAVLLATNIGLGDFVGPIIRACLGASTPAGANSWHGWLGPGILFDAPLTTPAMIYLSEL